MKKLNGSSALFILLLFCLPLRAANQERISLLIEVTNPPVTGNALIVNGLTRYWTNTSTVTTFQTNLVGKNYSKTNLYAQLAKYGFSGLTIQNVDTNRVRLVGSSGGPLTASISGTWAILTLSTQTASSTYTALWPLANISDVTNRQQQASDVVNAINSYATNAVKTNAMSMSNYVTTGASPTQRVRSPLILDDFKGTNNSYLAFKIPGFPFQLLLGSDANGVFGFTNAFTGKWSLYNLEPNSDDWGVSGTFSASNLNLTTIVGSGNFLAITPSGSVYRTNAAGSSSTMGSGNAGYIQFVEGLAIQGTNHLIWDRTNDFLQVQDEASPYIGKVRLSGQGLIQYSDAVDLQLGVQGNTNWVIYGGVFGRGSLEPTTTNLNVGSATSPVFTNFVRFIVLRDAIIGNAGSLTNIPGMTNKVDNSNGNATNLNSYGVMLIAGSTFQSGTGTNINSWYGSNYFGGLLQLAAGNPGAGKILTSDASGNATWQTGISGVGTNFPATITTGTNIVVGTGVRKSFMFQTNQNQGISFNGTPLNGEALTLVVTNTSGSASNITIGFFTNSVAGRYFDSTVASNVAGFLVVSNSSRTLHFVWNGNFWRLEGGSAKEMELVVSGGLTLATNLTSDTVTLATLVATNSYIPVQITGVGGANTNFTLQAQQPEVVINAFTNVCLNAIMSYDPGRVDYVNLTMTNGSGSDRTFQFQATTNHVRWAGVYGTNAPVIITNATALTISFRIQGTNVNPAGYTYFAIP